MAPSLFAGIRVTDLGTALPWYEKLFGEPSFQPNGTEMVWEIGEDRFVYVIESSGAGSSLVTIFTDDLETAVGEISARGLEPSETETYSNGVRKVTYRDPEGNEVGFGGGPDD